MSAQQQTLQLIREITSDGIVTFAELTNLATFLNENREARKNWPGTALFDVLRDILKDGRVDKHELDGLNLILEGIEIICAGNAQGRLSSEAPQEPATEPAIAAALAPEPEPVAPIVEQEVDSSDATPTVMLDVPTAREIELPELVPSDIRQRYDGVRLADYVCDCEDFRKVRRELPSRSPGRACKCIVNAIANEIGEATRVKDLFSEMLAEVIKVAGLSGRGLEAVEEWRILSLGNKKYVMSKGKTAWINIYAPNFEGLLEKYSYNRGYKRWGFGAFPKDQDTLKDFFDNRFEEVFGTDSA